MRVPHSEGNGQCMLMLFELLFQQNIIFMAEEALLGRGKKQSREAKRRFDECELKVRGLRSKNNEIQKQCENELDSDIRQAVKEQGYYLEREIGEIRTMMGKLSTDYTDPASKQRIKDLLAMAGKEIERNKRIMQDFINRASTSPSFLKSSTYQRGGRVSKTEMQHKASQKRSEGVSLIESDEITGEVIMQQRINAEKTALLREIEEKNNKINQLYNEMGDLIGGEQRDMLDQIDHNNTGVRDNLHHANQELDDAIRYQKKSKKKYYMLVTCIVLVVLIGAGAIYLFLK